MNPAGRLRATLRAHPVVVDAVASAVLFLLVLLVPDPDSSTRGLDDPPAVVALAALTCAAVAVRSRGPTAALVLTTAGTVLVTALVGERAALVIAVMLALYSVAVTTDRRTTVRAWILTVLALVAGAVVAGWTAGLSPEILSPLAPAGLAAAVGDAVRNSRAYVGALEERAARAEQTREDEARRRVAEERLRIARELHDVVAHHIAVVTVQAGVAGHLLRERPEAAEEALGHVRRAGRAILDELGDILTVLRQPDDPAGPAAPTAPAPGLGRLDALLASFGAAGLAVEWSLTGRPGALGATVDLVAYRVLEEALTNAHKHGTGAARIGIAWTPSSVLLEVTNAVPDRGDGRGGATGRDGGGARDGARPESGHGLLGMRERAAAVGGVLEVGRTPDGRFRVTATLPAQPADVPAGAAP